jgi:fucose 4-O-acetylase-like acetyltransferase
LRDEKIDILRFVGLAMIILAHVGPPSAIYQLRNFDVPLMVLVSGLSFRVSYKKEAYTSYVWKRIKRLVFPVWIFLTAYFLFVSLFEYPIQSPDNKTIITSYLLLSGIGYVWIIRVFLLVAIASPALLKFCRDIKSHAAYFSILAASYVGYELLLSISKSLTSSAAGKIFESTVFYIIPYGVIFAIGLRLPELSRSAVWRLVVGGLALFGTLAVGLFATTGKITSTQDFKYPPQIYYLSYAIGISGILWLSSDAIVTMLKSTRLYPAVQFIAQNSIWIYLWHIPLIQVFNLPFYFKYPVVFAVAYILTFIQVWLVRQVLIPKVHNPSISRNLNLLLTG